MALITETGAIVAGAESYVTVAEALTYHANRANGAWAAATTEAQEAALRNGTAYVDDAYRARWKGERTNYQTQPLEWPRLNVNLSDRRQAAGFAYGMNSWVPFDKIPQKVKDATCEAALRSLTGLLLADVDMTKSRQMVGPIETWYTATEIATIYPAIDALLSGLLVPTGQGSLTRG